MLYPRLLHNLVPSYPPFSLALATLHTFYSPKWVVMDLTSYSNTSLRCPLSPKTYFGHLPLAHFTHYPLSLTRPVLTYCFPTSSLMSLLSTLLFSLGLRIDVSLAHAFPCFLVPHDFVMVRACVVMCRVFVIDWLCCIVTRGKMWQGAHYIPHLYRLGHTFPYFRGSTHRFTWCSAC